MRILAIETSCDETAVTVLEAEGTETSASFRILGNALLSQIDIHQEFGGVYPAIAKREHAKNLVAMLHAALTAAGTLEEELSELEPSAIASVQAVLEREPGLSEALLEFLSKYRVPAIDVISVTHGPGLAPALWVGVNFAKVLSAVWHKPLVGANHMEGHLLSALAISDPADPNSFSIQNLTLPVLGLLISGGHTELVSMDSWLSYTLVGQTRDDAVGEAFDKVARMLGLPYPGGPEISKLAEEARAETGSEDRFALPRPMVNDPHCDFSFSGLKTSVRYLIEKLGMVTDEDRREIAKSFENAVADVLWKKTSRALLETHAGTLALGGGVSANTHIKRVFLERVGQDHPDVALYLPELRFTTDNAIMIGIAGFYRALRGEFADLGELRADGNLSIVAKG